jgi:hypothetical protein
MRFQEQQIFGLADFFCILQGVHVVIDANGPDA